jgi:YHS domain-containing protein
MNGLIKKTLLLIAVILVISPLALFYGIKLSPLSWQLLGSINENSSLALKGYDVVSYFHDNSVTQGDPTKGLRVNDTIWYFSSDENKLMFKTFPEKYQPQYGGYCATAIASGFTADINPEIWHIENGKLYLFLNKSAKNDFVANINQGIIEKADNEWAQR